MEIQPGRPRVLSCPSCGGNITLRAAGHSVNAVCGQCDALLDVARDEVRILEKGMQVRKTPRIPLGTRGRLEAREWEVVGYLERVSGPEGDYEWEEYLLFNPRHGYRFLTLDHSHWSLYRVVKTPSQLPEGLRFQRFFTGTVRVRYVLGEFYWRVKAGDEVWVTDSIAPPYLLSVEKNREEIQQALGRYLPREEVMAAFALLPARVPPPWGVAPHQPSPFADRLRGLGLATVLFLATATAVQFFQVRAAQRITLWQAHLAIPAHAEAPLLTPPLDLEQHANLCVETRASLQNNWAELALTLVNEDTQERRSLAQGLEYYSGMEGSERWSEGNPNSEDCFPAVPPGRYRLLLESEAGAYSWDKTATQDYWVQVRSDVPIWSNWLALILALGIYPLYLWIRSSSFELSRWAESEYTPEGSLKPDSEEGE